MRTNAHLDDRVSVIAQLIEGFASFPEGPANFVLPIVDGTAAHANVRGSVHVRDLPGSDGDTSNLDFHLLP